MTEWRNVAVPAERLMTLKAFHAAGFFTWVSIDPLRVPQHY
jgi:DNA repair photolyase